MIFRSHFRAWLSIAVFPWIRLPLVTAGSQTYWQDQQQSGQETCKFFSFLSFIFVSLFIRTDLYDHSFLSPGLGNLLSIRNKDSSGKLSHLSLNEQIYYITRIYVLSIFSAIFLQPKFFSLYFQAGIFMLWLQSQLLTEMRYHLWIYGIKKRERRVSFHSKRIISVGSRHCCCCSDCTGYR